MPTKLLGFYEQPLQPYIEQVIQTGYPTIINIGCAEGYYAVGLAHLDQLLAVWEWRSGPKPWLVMKTRQLQ